MNLSLGKLLVGSTTVVLLGVMIAVLVSRLPHASAIRSLPPPCRRTRSQLRLVPKPLRRWRQRRPEPPRSIINRRPRRLPRPSPFWPKSTACRLLRNTCPPLDAPGAADGAEFDGSTLQRLDAALLERAIECELILQSAHGKGIDLTDEQKQVLERLRGALRANYGPELPSDASILAAIQQQIEFQVRDATGQLLLISLVPAPADTSPESMAVHRQQVRHYLDTLRVGAHVEIAVK